jgi:hypothetical protein
MMLNKQQVASIFERELAAWDALLAGLSTAQLTEPWLSGGLSIKDTLAHLHAWQQRTIARLEAALHDRAPHYPAWPLALDEDEPHDAVDQVNAWILETQRDRPWPDIHRAWREGFLRFLELVRTIPEADLLPNGKLAWMAEYQLSDVLPGWYDHHHSEHRSELESWMRERRERDDA